MNIIGIDIGSSTVKIIEYKNDKILNKAIFESKDYSEIVDNFIKQNKIVKIDKFVVTGINAKKVNLKKYNIPVRFIKEFSAIATGGLYLSKKSKAIIASVGTGTALIRAESGGNFKHLGGTGLGAGTLTNLCNRFAGTKSFEDIIELSNKGNLDNVDLRIGDLTDEKIKTLPAELTLSNFGGLKDNATKADIVLGLLNMVFETIAMMTAFASINDEIKDIVLIGNILVIPAVKDIIRKINKTHRINFTIPENSQYAVIIGAIKEDFSG